MENKKELEQIFQKKLKDFEANPPQESWHFISEKINKKKEKKRINPLFCLKSAIIIIGAALIVLIGYFVFNLEKNGFAAIKSTKVNNQITGNHRQEKINNTTLINIKKKKITTKIELRRGSKNTNQANNFYSK